MCPHKRAFVLDHGLVGDDRNGNIYVSCPLHKRNFNLTNGECLNDAEFGILTFEVKEEDGFLLVKSPEENELESAIGTSKWMVSSQVARTPTPRSRSPFASRYEARQLRLSEGEVGRKLKS